MKSGLTVVLFRLFTIGVFAGGKESNGELVSVMEGDSVTLMSGVTEIQADDEIEWEFNGSLLATISIDPEWIKPDGPFRNRLQLDKQTGDLKISNIKTTDFGLYKPTISSPRGSPPEMTFNVSVLPTGAAKAVILNEGDFITLRTDVPDIQRDDVIRWRFGLQKSPVAEINRMAGIFKIYDVLDERFRDRLTLNNQTGSLNITNITTEHAGLYEADISRGKHTIHKSFSVTVRDEVKSVSVLMGDNVTLRTGLTEIQTDDKIPWKFGDQDIADLKTWSNIDLNSMTGDLTISNIQRDQSGHYKVEIITRRMILHRKYNCTITIGEMKTVSGKEGESVTLQINVTKIQSDDLIHWMFGNFKIAEFNKIGTLFSTSDVPDERFRLRLALDRQTGYLTIMNINSTHAGDYELKIISSRHIINRRITVTVSGSDLQSGSGLQSDAGMSQGVVAVIVVAVVVVLLAAAGFVCYRRKISERERQMKENGRNVNTQKTDDHATEETKMTNDP